MVFTIYTLVSTEADPISSPPRSLEVAASQLAGFQCDASSDFTPPYTVQWFKGDVEVLPQSDARLHFVNETGTLFIRDVKSSDAGTYSCVVTNAAGSSRSSANLTVVSVAELG